MTIEAAISDCPGPEGGPSSLSAVVRARSAVGAESQKKASKIAIDVCICTYHRPHIFETLKALARQEGCDAVCVRVIVADNAVEPTAEAAICATGRALGLDFTYIHAPARNISIARNACLGAAHGDWIAFLDDDEYPSPDWLRKLLAEARRGRWDAVLGPVQAIYPEATATWLRIGDFHSDRPVWIRGRIETGYTGNALIRRRVIERAGISFCVEFGRSGGEDLDFFYRLRDAGGRIGFAPDALVVAAVPSSRLGLRYLLRRNFRRGQSHGTQQLRRCRRRDVPLNLTLALAKASVLGLAAACQIHACERNRFLLRAALHCGAVIRLAGLSEIEVY